MPTYDTTTGLRALEGGNPISDIDAGFLALAQDTAALVGQFLAVVTTLPSSPVDGQRCLFLADAAEGVVWDLRYRAGSASPYKWEFVGGSAMGSNVESSETLATIANNDPFTYYNLPTSAGPSVTLPYAGYYDARYGSKIGGEGVGTFKGSVQPSQSSGIVFSGGGNAGFVGTNTASVQAFGTVAGQGLIFAAAPGATVRMMYQNVPQSGSGQIKAWFGQRWLRVTPVRLAA